MTLVEVVVALGVGTIILFAAYAVVSIGNQAQVRTADRVDSVQRGRVSMEAITRAIRSQQCIDDQAAVEVAQPYAMQFFSSVAAYQVGVQPMQKRRLEWKPDPTPIGFDDGTAVVGDIYETVWQSPEKKYPYSFPSTPTSVRKIAEDIEPDGTKPIFSYFKYEIVDGVGRPAKAAITTGAAGVPTDSLDEIIQVDIRFLSRPRRAKTAKSFTVPFYNRVSVRTADPTDPTNSPLCTK